ncbi:MAG: SpoIIE family protein phosphatase [Bacteroidia bacterium]
MTKTFRYSFLVFLFGFFHFISDAQSDSLKKGVNDKDSNVNIHVNLSDFVSGYDEGRVAVADSTMKLLESIDNLVKFSNPWKVKPGDNTAWAKENYDDRSWSEFADDSIKKNKKRKGSIAWYRMHFQIDSSLINIPLAFYIRLYGAAADVYLDGKFLNSYGTPGKNKEIEKAEFTIYQNPYAFSFTESKEHVFAVRYSDFHKTDITERGISLGKMFSISVKHINEEIADATDLSKYFPLIFFAAIFLTLSFFHLVLFVFNRQNRINLTYSIYCFGVFGLTYGIYHLLSTTDFASNFITLKLLAYAVPFIFVALVGMLHRIFYGKRLKIFWFIFGSFMLSLICLWSDNLKVGAVMVLVLFIIASFEILRVIFQAIRKKKDGAWIFAMVVLLAPLAGIVSSNLPDEFNISGLRIPNNTGAIVGSCFILGLPFAMTLYLSRDFARTGKQLKKQLIEIADLSERTIQQEKEKKQLLENQNAELERKVDQRTSEVVHQKEVIEIKNKEITDSLTYAKRIQSAILPDTKLIYKTLEQAFILYLPKDIVSGDFYGFAQKDNKVLIAAADCTGHGVAGAFMSMIGSSLLNQIINEKNITAPSLILDELDKGIIHALKQKETDSNDGMDISICAFDMQNKIVHYAGAHRPLWLIRNNQLQVYKPNKFPIGGLQIQHEEKFKQHEIKLETNDCIYIFSDGYADQFGGEKGKKLMSKKFKELLLSIHDLSMPEQEKRLHNHFETWKTNNEQVDDVLVIGIRV